TPPPAAPANRPGTGASSNSIDRFAENRGTLVAPALGQGMVERRRQEPPRGDDLLARVEPHAVRAGRVEVAQERALPPDEREERHRRGDADVDADHPGLDAAPELTPVRARRREDPRGDAVRARVDPADP